MYTDYPRNRDLISNTVIDYPIRAAPVTLRKSACPESEAFRLVIISLIFLGRSGTRPRLLLFNVGVARILDVVDRRKAESCL